MVVEWVEMKAGSMAATRVQMMVAQKVVLMAEKWAKRSVAKMVEK